MSEIKGEDGTNIVLMGSDKVEEQNVLGNEEEVDFERASNLNGGTPNGVGNTHNIVQNKNESIKIKKEMELIQPFHVAERETTNESDAASIGEMQHETMEQQQDTVRSQKAGKIRPHKKKKVGAGVGNGGGDCVGIAAEPDDGRCKGKQRERGRGGSRTWIVPAHHERVCVPEVDLYHSGNAPRVVDRTSIAAYCKLLRETIGEFTLDRELGGDTSCSTSTEYYLLGFANVCAIEAAN